MIYFNRLSKEKVLEIYHFTKKLRKFGYGQRTIRKEIKDRFKENFSESTISGWIHKGNIPFAHEKTQFKPKPKPLIKELKNLYLIKKISAQRLARKYHVSTITAINWLKCYGIKPRSHKESMNTPLIKGELSHQKIIKLKGNYKKLTIEKAYILGVLCGDAYIGKYAIKLEIRNDEEFIKYFTKCVSKVYGINCIYRYYKLRNSFISDLSRILITRDLFSYGKFNTYIWTVPKIISKSKDYKIIGNFLKGFYDSEGCMTKSTITVSSVSKRGIHGIVKLLQRLKINTSKMSKYKNKYYSFCISGKDNITLFNKCIGFTIKRKNILLQSYLKNVRSYKKSK